MKKLIGGWAAVAVAVMLPLPLSAADASDPAPLDSGAVDEFVEFQIEKHRVPGLALAMIEGGQVTHLAGFGEADDGVPVTPDTPFVLGSISKSFTAVAVLQLVERELIDLDAPVRTYLPGFAVADPAASAAITPRHLLQHTSGLSELGYNRVLDRETTLEEAVADLERARPTAAVGMRFQYFNQGYSVLALLVETVIGQAYGDYVVQHIFEPLEMTRSFADRDHAEEAGLAQGHTKLFGFALPRDLPFTEFALGYGNLISTARDLSRFALAISGDGTYDGATILSPDSVALMRTPPSGVADTNYGLGWFVWESDGVVKEGHSGGEETFMASLTLLPGQEAGFIWLMNQEHFLDPVRGQLDAGLTDLLLGGSSDLGGMSMRWLGLGLLAAVLGALGLAVRSAFKLRGWTERSRGLSTAAVVRKIAPHVIVPALILWVIYRYLGPVVLGEPVAWNFRYVGSYFFPEIALLLLLAIVPDLLQAAYMTGTFVVDRLARSRPDGGLDATVSSSQPVPAAFEPRSGSEMATAGEQRKPSRELR